MSGTKGRVIMDNISTQKELDEFFQNMENLRLKFNADKKFNEIIKKFIEEPFDHNNEIFSLLDNIVLSPNSQFILTLPANTELYRAREILIDDYKNPNTGLSITHDNNHYITEGYNMANSIEPPLGTPAGGRNNITGASYLYAASDPITACTEIKSSLRSLISLAKFTVCKDLKIIDFSQNVAFERNLSENYNMSLGIFFSSLMFSFSKPDSEIYHFTQIISDYLRKTGIDGLAYLSFYTGKTNYTIFNSHKFNIKFDNSRIVSHHFTNEIFWDFNNKDTLKSCDEASCNYNDDEADNILKDLQIDFNKR